MTPERGVPELLVDVKVAGVDLPEDALELDVPLDVLPPRPSRRVVDRGRNRASLDRLIEARFGTKPT